MAKKESKPEQSKDIISKAHAHLPIPVYCCDECGEPWATKHFFSPLRYCKTCGNKAFKKWAIAVGIASISLLINLILF